MDPDRVLQTQHQPNAWETGVDVIVDTSRRLKMACQWIEFLIRLHEFLVKKRADWKKAGGSPGPNDNIGGLKDYSLLFEREHKDIGIVTNNKWIDASYDREDSRLKLKYEPETDERSEEPVPMFYKSEGEPAQTPGFTVVNPSVNRESFEQESANGTSTLPPPSQLMQGPLPPYSAQRHHSVETPTDMDAARTSAYYQGSQPHHAVSQTSHTLYSGEQLQNPAAGYAEYWSHPSRQQETTNLTGTSHLELEGQTGLGACDIASMQLVQHNPIGDNNGVYDNFYGWTGSIPQSQTLLTTWNGSSFEPYPNLNTT